MHFATDFRETFENTLQRLATEYGDLERQRAGIEHLKQFGSSEPTDERCVGFRPQIAFLLSGPAAQLRHWKSKAAICATLGRLGECVRATSLFMTHAPSQPKESMFSQNS